MCRPPGPGSVELSGQPACRRRTRSISKKRKRRRRDIGKRRRSIKRRTPREDDGKDESGLDGEEKGKESGGKR